MSPLGRATWSIACTIGCSAPATAQEVLWTREGSPPPVPVQMVGPMAFFGDVDQDGCEDLVQIVGGVYPLGGLWMFSGRDGKTLRLTPWPYSQDWSPQSLGRAGDSDADGVGDYALGILGNLGQGTRVRVHSGRDDRILLEVRGPGNGENLFGREVLGDLDLDGDRKADLVVGAERDGTRKPNEPWPGGIYAYSNQGSLLYHIVDLPGITYLGRQLARIGDVDSDGCDDFVSMGVEIDGVALVFSGKSGKLLYKAYGDKGSLIGEHLTGCGDIDADGAPDFVGGSVNGYPMARAFSGRTGRTIHSWYSKSVRPGFGWVIAAADVDLDGLQDVFLTNDEPDSGRWVIATYSGRDGTRVLRHVQTDWSGGQIEATGPQLGQRFPCYAVLTQRWMNGTDVGRITMYRLNPLGVEKFGLACAGNLPQPPRIGIRMNEQIAGTRIQVSDGAPGGTGVLVVGLSRTSWLGWPLPFPLAPFGFPSCSLFTSADLLIPAPLGSGPGNPAGYGFVDVPHQLSATGTPLHAQWLVLRPPSAAAGGASEALRWRFAGL